MVKARPDDDYIFKYNCFNTHAKDLIIKTLGVLNIKPRGVKHKTAHAKDIIIKTLGVLSIKLRSAKHKTAIR